MLQCICLGALYNWEKTFHTEDKLEVETVLASLGYQVEWREGELCNAVCCLTVSLSVLSEDLLHYWYVMASVREHPHCKVILPA